MQNAAFIAVAERMVGDQMEQLRRCLVNKRQVQQQSEGGHRRLGDR